MRALIYNGIIPCVIFFFLYIRAMHLAATRKHSALIATLVLMAICGISERFMLDVYYNFPLLICCAALLRQSSASEEITHLPFEYAKKVIVQIRDWYITTFPRDPEAE